MRFLGCMVAAGLERRSWRHPVLDALRICRSDGYIARVTCVALLQNEDMS